MISVVKLEGYTSCIVQMRMSIMFDDSKPTHGS